MNHAHKPQRRLVALTASLSIGIALAAAGCAASHSHASHASGSAAAVAAASTGATTTSANNTAPAAGTSSSAPAAGNTGAAGAPAAAAPPPTTQPAARTIPVAPSATTPPSTTGPVTVQTHPAPPLPPPVPASSLPNAVAVDWQPMGGLVPMDVPAARAIGITECAGVQGAAAWHEQGYVSNQHTPAQEDIFGFSDTATATKVFQNLAAGFDSCAATSRALQQKSGTTVDAAVAATATADHARAWSRQWTGVAGQSAPGPQTNHYYLVQRGATVIVAAFTEFGANPPHRYDTAGDSGVLTMLAANAAG